MIWLWIILLGIIYSSQFLFTPDNKVKEPRGATTPQADPPLTLPVKWGGWKQADLKTL